MARKHLVLFLDRAGEGNPVVMEAGTKKERAIAFDLVWNYLQEGEAEEDGWTLWYGHMTRAEIAAMPEHDGW